MRSASESSGKVGIHPHASRRSPIQHGKIMRSTHSAARTFERGNVRRPLRSTGCARANVARDHRHRHTGRVLLNLDRSARLTGPERTACPRLRRGWRRRFAQFVALPRGLQSMVQSCVEFGSSTDQMRFARNGLSSTRISVCALDSSSTVLRFPNRVFGSWTRNSRKLSNPAGLVTC